MEFEDFPEDTPPEVKKWLSEQKGDLSILLIYLPQYSIAAFIPGDLPQTLYLRYRDGELLDWLRKEKYKDWAGSKIVWSEDEESYWLEDFSNYQSKLRE